MDSFNKGKTILEKIRTYFNIFLKKALDFLSGIPYIFKRKKILLSTAQVQADFDKKLVYSLSKSRIPNLKQFKYIKKYLTKKELWMIRISALVIISSLVFVGVRFYSVHLQVLPAKGGRYIEGVVGAPNYINPLYANVNDVDSDISSLIYSSLFKRGKNGELINDLATEYTISEDGKSYTVKIRTDAKWHDGRDLNIDDVIFTFSMIKDKNFKSTLRPSFSGVEIEKVNKDTVKFLLPESYAAFLDLLTFGIMPKEIWQQIQPESANLAELNLKPIGSGPYKFNQLIKDKSGVIKEYDLVVNEDYYGKTPYIDIDFMFFSTFEEAIFALNENLIDGISYLPREMNEQIITPLKYDYRKLALPQITAIFLNQEKNSFLKDKNIRQVLAYSVNRGELIEKYFAGEAQKIDGPILPSCFAYKENIKKYDFDINRANELLEGAGWKMVEITQEDIAKAQEVVASESEDITDEQKSEAQKLLSVGSGKWRKKDKEFLAVKLTTVEGGENEAIAKNIKEYWERAGVKTSVELFSSSNIQAEIIKVKNFEILLYGQIVGADPDPYAFWHSSQIGEGGLNIANYSNKDVDQLLEDARTNINIGERKEKYDKFQEIIAEEVPAIFLYSSFYTYLQTKDLKGFGVASILFPHDRFANVNEWYIKTEKRLVW